MQLPEWRSGTKSKRVFYERVTIARRKRGGWSYTPFCSPKLTTSVWLLIFGAQDKEQPALDLVIDSHVQWKQVRCRAHWLSVCWISIFFFLTSSVVLYDDETFLWFQQDQPREKFQSMLGYGQSKAYGCWQWTRMDSMFCGEHKVHCTVYCFRTAEQLWHPVYSHFEGSAMAGKLNQVTFTNAFGCFLDLSSDTARVLSNSCSN